MTPLTSNLYRYLLVPALALGAALLGACGAKDAPLPSTQVAAKVNSEEISVHQINATLAQGSSRGSTPEQVQKLSRTILEDLIDQQVAVDQAVAAKLHRDPEVIAQVEAARRGVLAGAYVKSYIAGLPKVSEQDAKKYFAENPALFSERRIFNVQEIVAVRSPEVVTQLESMAATNRSMEEISAWLKARNIAFKPTSANRAAEQIPLELLPRLHALKDGQVIAFTSPEYITVLRLVSSKAEPVSEALALPRIAQFLSNQRVTEAVTAQIKTLRSQATVVYQGEFATPLPQAVAAAVPATLPAAVPVSPAPPATVSSTLEKGVAGLK